MTDVNSPRQMTPHAVHAPDSILPREPRTESEPGFADDFSAVLENTTGHRSTIGCIIPAYNEAGKIESVPRA